MPLSKDDALSRIERVLAIADESLKAKYTNEVYKAAALSADTIRRIAWEHSSFTDAIPEPTKWNYDGLLQLKGLLQGLQHAVEHGDIDL